MRLGLIALLFLSHVHASELLAEWSAKPRMQLIRTERGAELHLEPVEALKLSTPLPAKKYALKINTEISETAMIVSVVAEGESQPGLTLWLARAKSSWALRREWPAKNTVHEFTFNSADSLTRKSRCINVESIPYTLECGCCNALQTRTIETVEEETLAWNEKSRTADQAKFSRWYVTQPGEGMINIVRKLYGDARPLARLYRLNPELQKQTTLKCGQRILIDQSTADRPN